MVRSTRSLTTAQPRAFTLVELLVVIGVIALLVMLLLPAIQAARESSRGVACQNHLRQWTLAILNYETVAQELPPGMQQDLFPTAPIYRGSSLFVFALPFVEESHLYRTWNFRDPRQNALGGRSAGTAQTIPTLVCPSDVLHENPVAQGDQFFGLTSYGGNGGRRAYLPQHATVDGLFHTTGTASQPEPQQRPVRIAEILGGTSKTWMLGERAHGDAELPTLVTWGWWAPAGGRKTIGHVTMSAYGGLNFRLTPGTLASAAGSSASSVGAPAGTGLLPADSPEKLSDQYPDVERRLSSWGSHHPSGANFSAADGSVRFVANELDTAVLLQLSTRSAD